MGTSRQSLSVEPTLEKYRIMINVKLAKGQMAIYLDREGEQWGSYANRFFSNSATNCLAFSASSAETTTRTAPIPGVL